MIENNKTKLARLRVRRRLAKKRMGIEILTPAAKDKARSEFGDWQYAVKAIERLTEANAKLMEEVKQTTAGFNRMVAKLEEIGE